MDPELASSLPVWVLYLVIIVPLFRLLKLTLDAWADEVRDVLWVRRNRWERSGTAAVLVSLLAYNRLQFVEHLRLVASIEVPLLFRAHFGAVLVDPSKPTRRLLVIGEVGDGKSTLVGALRDPAQSPVPESGKRPRGITKKITNYVHGMLEHAPHACMHTCIRLTRACSASRPWCSPRWASPSTASASSCSTRRASATWTSRRRS